MPGLRRLAAGAGDQRALSRWLSIVGYLLLGTAVLFVSQTLIGRLGGGLFLGVLVGVFFAAVFSVISFRHLPIPFYLWILSVGGFRFIWSIQTPLLPDLFLDRLTMVWLAIVFMVKYVAERRTLRGPFKLDLLILAHGLYMLVQIIFHDMEFFHDWTMSVLIPYSSFFLAKNIIQNRVQVRSLLWVVLALSVYYNVTSVAEKYDINWLLWPKYMVGAEGMFKGRSLGPFMQAPLFGTVIGMLLPVHLYFLATTRQLAARLLLVASMLVGFAGLYFTYTRGSWLAGIAALVATVALNRRVYFRFVAPVAILAPVLAIAVLGVAQDKFMKERVENDDTIGSRLGTAVTVLRVWRDHPLFGVGFFQYRNIREQYIQPVEVPGMPTIRFSQFRENPIHDIYLGPLAETGLVGSVMQYGIYFLILRAFLRKFARRGQGDHFSTYVMPVFGGLMIGYLVGGLAFDYRFFSVVGTFFLMSAGIIDGYRLDQGTKPEAADAAAV